MILRPKKKAEKKKQKKKKKKKKAATIQRLKPNWHCSNGSKKRRI